MEMRLTAIPVQDANGAQLTIYQTWKTSFFGFVAEERLELCTGERVERFDRNTFIVLRTGKKLTRISASS